MSAALGSKSVGQTKKFGKSERTIPHPSQKAQKWYPTEDEQQPKKVSVFENIINCDLRRGLDIIAANNRFSTGS